LRCRATHAADRISASQQERSATVHPVNFRKALEGVTEYWSPKVVGRVNDQYVKVAKLKGELAWHKHDDEDELFQVITGRLIIQFEGNEQVLLEPGDAFVVPRGTMHNPVAETVTTKHTGDVVTPLTKTIEQQLA
jgi:mannose-6-phosphate isomerase-like protein (cupin superfamily)